MKCPTLPSNFLFFAKYDSTLPLFEKREHDLAAGSRWHSVESLHEIAARLIYLAHYSIAITHSLHWSETQKRRQGSRMSHQGDRMLPPSVEPAR